MLKNYLKIALRTLQRQKLYTLLNLFGLTVGLVCVFLIGLYVRHELAYDRFHENADRVYRVVEQYFENEKLAEESASIPIPFGPTFSEYAGVKATRLYQTYQKTPLLAYQDRRFSEERFFFTDSTFFEVFTFPLVRGNPATALAEPFTLVITERAAQKYFGEADPVGKVLTFEGSLDFRITGVAADPPTNAHFQFDFLAAMQNLEAIFAATGNEASFTSWFWNPAHTYILLPPGTEVARIEALLPAFVEAHYPSWLQSDVSYYLQPLTSIHLHSDLYQEIRPNGSYRTVQLLGIVGVLILLIACINFMNLATARSLQRAREVGVRKVLGARRKQLIAQFLGESLMVSVVAALLAAGLTVALLPAAGALLGAELPRSLAGSPGFVVAVVVLALVVGVLAGLYPAFVLSAYRPVRTLQGSGSTHAARAATLRKALVVGQFAISIALLVSTLVVYQQLRYLQQKELGFDEEQVVMISLRGTSLQRDYEAAKAEILRQTGVQSASGLSDVVGHDVALSTFQVEGDDAEWSFPGLFADPDIVETLGLTLVAGRSFRRDSESDRDAVLVNQALVDLFDWEEGAVNKTVNFWRDRTIVGVVDDFNFEPLRQQVRPLVILFEPKVPYFFLAIRLAPGDARPMLAALEAVWKRFEPARPFEPFFLDTHLDALYAAETQLGRSYGVFSLLAILVACLGLFGLASFTAERRTKEIGVRKVLGASVGSLLVLLSKDFVRLVLIAFVIAVPAAYFALDRWLQNFAYRVDLGVLPFVGAGLLALVVALLTISYQSVRAATTNPANVLHME